MFTHLIVGATFNIGDALFLCSALYHLDVDS